MSPLKLKQKNHYEAFNRYTGYRYRNESMTEEFAYCSQDHVKLSEFRMDHQQQVVVRGNA